MSYASSFTVGNQDVEITAVRFLLASGASPSAADTTACIFSNSGILPGALLGSSHRSFTIGELTGGFSFYDYVFDNPLTLSAGSTYWTAIGINPIGHFPYIAYTDQLNSFAGNAITPSLTHCTGLNNHSDGSWSLNAPTITLAYELKGAVVPVPEPALGLLIFVGLGLWVFQTRRQKRRAEQVSNGVIADNR